MTVKLEKSPRTFTVRDTFTNHSKPLGGIIDAVKQAQRSGESLTIIEKNLHKMKDLKSKDLRVKVG